MTELFCNDGRCERVRRGERHPVHDLTELEENRTQSLTELLNFGSELTGGSVGTAAGFALAGPGGAVAGSIIGTGMGYALKHIGQEVARRFLSPREKTRMGAVLIQVKNKIERNVQRGLKLRKDEFFTDTVIERSAAKEIAEGVLLAAQKEHEEKKLSYYGNLLANIAFS